MMLPTGTPNQELIRNYIGSLTETDLMVPLAPIEAANLNNLQNDELYRLLPKA